MKDLTEKIIQEAKAMGFIAIGFTTPSRPAFFDQFTLWLSERKNADMSWFDRNLHLREDPSLLLDECSTIISLSYPYSANKPCTPDGLTVARYSRPDRDDYHDTLKRLCKDLVKVMKEYDSRCSARIFVDSAPVLERSIAYSAGIGFIGKNNMLIIPGVGSYFYLAEIFTSIHFEAQSVRIAGNQCGSCTLCINACPMGALEKPFFINASKCLSYLTVEYKGQVGALEGRRMEDCLFGCDRCQEACPFNGQAQKREILLPSSDEILNMQEDEFAYRFGRTSFKRTGIEKIKGNIRAIREGSSRRAQGKT